MFLGANNGGQAEATRVVPGLKGLSRPRPRATIAFAMRIEGR